LMNFRQSALLAVDVIIPDTFREASYQVLKAKMAKFRI
jgi:hypothetical protein